MIRVSMAARPGPAVAVIEWSSESGALALDMVVVALSACLLQ